MSLRERLTAARARHDEAEGRELHMANLATVVVFGGLALVLATSLGWLDVPPRWVLLAAGALFIPVAVVRSRSARTRRRAFFVVEWLERAEARAADQFDFGQPDGSEFIDRSHEYAYDLDLFGPHSIFYRLNACHTGLGRGALATALAGTNHVADLSVPQSAVRELVAKVDEREALEIELRTLIERAGRGVDELASQTLGLVDWARGPSPAESPPWISVAARVMPFVAIGGLGVWLGLEWPWWTAALPYAINLWIGSRVKDLSTLMNVFEGVRRTLNAWADTVETAAGFRFTAPPLQDTVGRLSAQDAPSAIRRLGKLADGLSQRRNAFWGMTGNVVLLSDVRARNALVRWHRDHGEELAHWMEAVAELEAWGSLASYAESQGDPVWPEATDNGPMVEAVEIAHPLLDRATRVGNDGKLVDAGATWVVTGSNMSGKSTFIRALGLGVIFARLGLPVTARRLNMRNLRVVTSMKVEESLHAGSSRFHAEVQRLSRCLDWGRRGSESCVIGRNLRRHKFGGNAAWATIAVLERLRSLGAVTLVSTHDLGLSDVLDEWTSETRVVHFTDRVEDGKMIFDYEIKDGRLPSTNALEVMRAEGIPIDPRAE